MPEESLRALLSKLRADSTEETRGRLLYHLYPEDGPLSRHAYTKHMEFFAAGAVHNERCFLGANRSGKSFCVGFEASCHLIGWYPDWWVGRRFDRPVVCWAAGEDVKAVRESLQPKLIGTMEEKGTGLIPKHNIVDVMARSGVSGAADYAVVRHAKQGYSRLVFKCFVAGTYVRMANLDWCPIERIKLRDTVLCADGTGREVTEVHAYSQAPTIKIITRSGTLRLTPGHELFLPDGTKIPACQLKIGDVLQSAGCDEHRGAKRQEDWRVKLTALMIGDGCVRARTPFFTCNEPEIVEEVRSVIPEGYRLVPIKNTISYKIAGDEHKYNVLKHSLEADGLWGQKSITKFIPGWVFRLPRDQKIIFLRWLWGCDGNLKPRAATYATSSPRLAHDVRLLLWDLEIYTDVKEHWVGCNGKKFLSFYVPLSGENRIKFQEIGKLNRDVECTLKPRPKGPYHEVLEIAAADPADVFCITVADAHEFIAEGFRSGNSYDQGRESFQASEVDIVLLDEEPPLPIYTESLTRTIATVPGKPNGTIMCAFTPLKGISETVLQFLPGGAYPATQEARLAAWGW